MQFNKLNNLLRIHQQLWLGITVIMDLVQDFMQVYLKDSMVRKLYC